MTVHSHRSPTAAPGAAAGSPTSAAGRVGLVADFGTTALEILQRIQQIDASRLGHVWIAQPPVGIDAMGLAAVAAANTTRVRLGTSVIPAYPRHPLTVVGQAMLVEQLAPRRFRLGVGPSHGPLISGIYGIDYRAPLAYTREYTEVLRTALWDGRVQHSGRFFTIDATVPAPTCTPIVLSALGPKSFRQAGEISDGAISWMCPIDYLVAVALPALRSGAAASGRAAPPLIAHVPIAMTNDRATVRSALSGRVSFYARLPAYANAFASAGHAISDDGTAGQLADELAVWGTDDTITQRLNHILASGIAELALQLLVVHDRDDELTHLLELVDSL